MAAAAPAARAADLGGTSQNITNGKKLTTKTTFEQCIKILKSNFLNLIVTDLSGFLTLFHSALYDARHLYAVIHDGPCG